jgi:hypothetical protein
MMSGDKDDPDDDSVAGEAHEGEDDELPQQDDEPPQEQPPSGDQGAPQGQQGGGQPQGAGGAGVGAGAGAPPQGGQPQGQQGPPQGGQPQGGYQQGGARQPVQTGPSVGDIFSRPDTKDEIVSGVVVYAMVGLGVFLAAFLVPLGANVFYMATMLAGALALGPTLAVILADRQDDELSDVPDNLVYANVAVTALAGTLVFGFLAAFGGAIGNSVGSSGIATAGSFAAGDYILAVILVSIAAAVAAAAVVALNRTVLADSPAPQGGQQQPPAQGQGQTMQGQGGNQPPQQGQQR